MSHVTQKLESLPLHKKFNQTHNHLPGATDEEMDALVVILATAVEKHEGKLVANQPASTRQYVDMHMGKTPQHRNKITMRQAQLLVTNKYIVPYANILNLANPRIVYQISQLGTTLLESPRAEAPQGLPAFSPNTDVSGPSAVIISKDPVETSFTLEVPEKPAQQDWAPVRAIFEKVLTDKERIHPSQEEAFWNSMKTTYGANLLSYILSFAAFAAYDNLRQRTTAQHEREMRLVHDLIIDPLTGNLPKPTELEVEVNV